MGIQINGNNDIISALDGSWTAEGASINTSGILTATTFKGNVTGTACTFVDGNFTGNVTIGGTLTYEDVTNIDSVGIITARDGLKVLAGGANVVGVVTATSFVGALPISNESNDRVLTSSGSGVINAEANLSMTGNILTFNTTANSHRIQNIATGDHYTEFRFDSNRSSAAAALAAMTFYWDGDQVADIICNSGADTSNKDDGYLTFRTSPSQGSITERLRITSDGKIGIGTEIPGAEFEVRGAGTVALFQGTGGNAFIGLTDVDAGAGIGYIGSDGGALLFQTPGSSYSTKLQITSAGDVCINRTGAIEDAKLSIQCDATQAAIGIQCNHTNTDTDLITAFNSSGKNIVNITAETDNSPYLKFEILSGNTAIERFRVNHLGNVAIGGGIAPNRLEIIEDPLGFPSDSAQPNATLLIKHGTSGSNRRWVGIGASLTGAWIQSSSPGGSGLAAPFWINKGGGDVTLGNDKFVVKSNGQIGVNMAPSADAQFCIKNSDDSNYNVLDVYNDNGNKMGGFSQDSTGNGTVGARTNGGDLNVLLRSSGNSYFKGGRLLIGTDAHSISSSEMFEVKHATTGFSYFENDNTSGYAPIYISNKGSNSGFAPIITITDGGGNRGGLGLNSSEVLRVHGQGGVEMYTGGTMGGGTQHWRINNLGDLTHTFAGRHGNMIGSTDGSGAYILLDGAEGNPLSSGTDYMYMEHTSGGNFEMWNGNGSVSTTKFMEVSPAGYIKNPKQPSFAAYRSQSGWTVSAGTEMVFNATRHNIGSHYSTSNGRFTAPISGSYFFSFFSIHNTNVTSGYIRLFKNGSRLYGGDLHFTFDQSSHWDNVAFSQVLELSANDYVSVYNGNPAVNYHGNHWQLFSGYLLG